MTIHNLHWSLHKLNAFQTKIFTRNIYKIEVWEYPWQFFSQGQDGGSESNERPPEGKASSSKREVETIWISVRAKQYMQYWELNHKCHHIDCKNRYHALLELYNEALEEPKEVSSPNFKCVSIFVCSKAKSPKFFILLCTSELMLMCRQVTAVVAATTMMVTTTAALCEDLVQYAKQHVSRDMWRSSSSLQTSRVILTTKVLWEDNPRPKYFVCMFIPCLSTLNATEWFLQGQQYTQ